MKTILISGGYGYKDAGDEAQLSAQLANMRKRMPESHFVIFSDNPENTRIHYREQTEFSINHYLSLPVFGLTSLWSGRSGRRENQELSILDKVLNGSFVKLLFLSLILIFNAKRMKKNQKTIFLNCGLKHFLQTIKDSDLLFNVGGGNLTSVWRLELRSKCLLLILFRIFEKPVVLSGQTIGPFCGWLDRVIARYALNRVNLITLREKNSKDNLRNLGVNYPMVKVTGDDSSTLIPICRAEIKEIFNEKKIDLSSRPIIGLNIIGLRYLRGSNSFEKSKRILARIADYLVVKHNATIVFFPTQYGDNDDRVSISEVLKLMERKHNVFTFWQELSDRAIKGLISELDLVIGFRYHFLVFAVDSGVPSIGLYAGDYYSTKVNGLLSLVGLEQNAIDVENATFEELIDIIEKNLIDKKAISNMLEERTAVIEKLSIFSVDYARKILYN